MVVTALYEAELRADKLSILVGTGAGARERFGNTRNNQSCYCAIAVLRDPRAW